ncbi:Uncharacterised protein [Enterobacter cloacae]|nr:Uncharacterised protein [Enterobacter cloacae]
MFGLLPRQRKAPDLVALGFVVIRKPGAEAFKQVRFGHHHIHREANTQLFMQLGETLAQVDRLLARGLSGLRKQVGNADGDNHAVDGLATAVFTQQVDKFQPLPGVLNLLTLLSGIAPRGIQQNRLVGEPPVTVARAANAAQRGFTEAVRQRELQPGVGQRGGFTGTRRANNDVPRQLIEVLRAEALRPLRAMSRFAEVGFFQHLGGFIETPGKDLLLAVQTFLRIGRLRAGGIFVELVHQLTVQPGVIQPRQNVALGPNQVDHRNADDAVLL